MQSDPGPSASQVNAPSETEYESLLSRFNRFVEAEVKLVLDELVDTVSTQMSLGKDVKAHRNTYTKKRKAAHHQHISSTQCAALRKAHVLIEEHGRAIAVVHIELDGRDECLLSSLFS